MSETVHKVATDTDIIALPENSGFELAPAWVCEALSPSTAHTGRVTKMPLHARDSVSQPGLVAPDLKTLEVYILEEGHGSLLATLKDDGPVRRPPFVAIECPLGSLGA